MTDDLSSDVLTAVWRDAVTALVLLATEDELRRAVVVACAANGVAVKWAEAIAAELKAALDEVVGGKV
jgi:predicted phosphoribosyltransferase